MRKTDINIGDTLEMGGDIVTVTGFEQGGVVIESQEIGEDLVKASKLKPLEPRQATEWY